MSGGGEGSSGAKRAAQSQAFIARDLFKSTEPGRIAGLDQALNILRTGGRGGTIPPVLKNILSASNQANKSSVDSTVDAVNKTGGGDFKTGIINQIVQSGGQTREAARDSYVRNSLQRAPDLSIQPVQLATQGLQGLVRRGAQEQVAKQQKENAIIQGSASAAGAIAAAAIIAAIAYSRREMKTNIEYLSSHAIDILAETAEKLPITTFTYRGETHSRLGLIIEDIEKDMPLLITEDHNHVDLYGIATLALAAVQSQAKRIAALEARLDELTK